MGIYYNLNYICDSCEQEYLATDQIPKLPPHWICIKPFVVNKDGFVVGDQEIEVLLHFCSHECVVEFMKSEEFKEWILLASMEGDEDDNDDDED